MKLTLRVLLAYLDEILSPDEHKQVEAMIAESQVARQILERLRAVVRDPELRAPPVSGPELRRWDPNRVAEYLDRVLPVDKVTEFEKFCLNSDVELAELVGVHHALKLVLQGAPEFDKSVRERMYGVVQAATAAESMNGGKAAFEDAPITETGVATMGGGGLIETVDTEKTAAEMLGVDSNKPLAPHEQATPADQAREERLGVPAEVRKAAASEQLWRRAIPVLALLLVLGLGAAVLYAIKETGPEYNNTALTNPGDNPDAVPDPVEPTTPPVEPEGTPTVPGETPVEGETEPEVVGVLPSDTEPVTPPPGETTVPGEMEGPGPTVPGEQPMDPVPPITVPGENPAPGENPMPATPVPMPGETEPPVAPVEPAAPRVVVGSYASTGSILFLAKAEADRIIWQRLAPRSRVLSGDRLVALNSFRPSLDLTDSVNIELLGGSIVEVLPPDENGISGLELVQGRIVVKPLSGEASFHLTLLDQTYLIELGEGSILGVQSKPVLPEGANPETQPPRVVEAFYYLGSGSMTVSGKESVLNVPASPSRGTFVPLQEVDAQVVNWLTGSDVAPIDQRAATMVEREITAENPGAFRLLEITQSEQLRRLIEVRMLALRGLVTLGEYLPVVQALAADDLKPRNWEDLIGELRDALARGPEEAQRVRAAFMTAHPTDGDLLYRMLWGYSDAELARGADAQLVGMLEHASLTHRVLAVWNLKRILGGKSLLYDPSAIPAERAKAAARWRDKLNQGGIRSEGG
jgi:hypothetical protein